MRNVVAALLAILIPLSLHPSRAAAQVTGEVESLGFNGVYRPGCWTPIVVNLTPLSGKTDNYLLRVRQEDMDRDHPVFTRTASLTGASADRPAPRQRFRTYFMPQPTDGGLIDPFDTPADPRLTAAQVLAKQLPVELWSTSQKLVARLPLTCNLTSIDPKPSGFDPRVGHRLVLAVHTAQAPPQKEYDATTGLLENVDFVPVRVDDLPESSIGYDAVDAVLWLDADPAELLAGGEEKLRALEQFVRAGGHLVICQSPQWQRFQLFGDLLPVTLTGVKSRDDASPLRNIAVRGLRDSVLWPPEELTEARKAAAKMAGKPVPERQDTSLQPRSDDDAIDKWMHFAGPFTVAIADPKPNAYVEIWMPWNNLPPTPFIVRRLFGAGAVTWVAQDLTSDEMVPRAGTLPGWPFIWQTVFDWKDQTRLIHEGGPAERQFDPRYAPSADCDEFGAQLNDLMELPGRSAALIGVAFAFFLAYWVVAGIGGYAFLAAKRLTRLSWFVFGATALAATLVTVAIVRLMLSGPPELKHFSLVRIAPNQPAIVYSRFGLYIPRDGYQRLEIAAPAPNWPLAMCAYGMHPLLKREYPENNGPEYDVPVQDEAAEGALALSVPYRSTLKRFQATWAGDLPQRIESARVRLTGQQVPVQGSLTNKTEHDLTDVFIAVKGPPRSDPGDAGEPTDDYLLYLPRWNAGVSLDLAAQFTTRFAAAEPRAAGNRLVGIDGLRPGIGEPCLGRIAQDWQPFWERTLPRGFDADSLVSKPLEIIPIVSFFSRIPPLRADTEEKQRRELRRLGARHLDCSPALAAGAVVIVATLDDDPLPIPLTVQGTPTPGSGKTIYQFIIPADTTVALAPPSRVTTQP